MLNTCKIRVIVIDNAHYLDEDALELLAALHHYLADCALILSAEQFDDQTPEMVLKDAYEHLEAFQKAHLYTIPLERVTLEVFKKEVMPRLLGRNNLRATFAPVIKPNIDKIYEDLFRETNGSWHRIDMMAEEFDAAIRRRGLRGEDGIAMITQEVINDVLARLRGQRVVAITESAANAVAP